MWGRRDDRRLRLASDIQKILDDFDSTDLATASPTRLLYLVERLRHANKTAWSLLQEHDEREPSIFWFHVSVWPGLGGLAMTNVGLAAWVIAIGGGLSAGKSLYDKGAHLILEQRYLGLFWAVESRKDRLKAAMTARGIAPE